jgi:hypothetical protein
MRRHRQHMVGRHCVSGTFYRFRAVTKLMLFPMSLRSI